MKVNGTVEQIYYQKDSWSCIRFFPDGGKEGSYIAKGNIPDSVIVGTPLILEGEFVTDPKYGKQFKVEKSVSMESPVVAVLSKCVPGIGHKTSSRIVSALGEDCINKILADPDVLNRVKGIKARKTASIYAALKKDTKISFYLDIFRYFKNNVTQYQADLIIEACGGQIKRFAAVKKDPYWLISHVDGFGFKRVDQLAMASGQDELGEKRIWAACIYAIKTEATKKGHCFLRQNELLLEVYDLLLKAPEFLTTRKLNVLKAILCDSYDPDEEEKKEDVLSEISDFINAQKKTTSESELSALKEYCKKAEIITKIIKDLTSDEMAADSATEGGLIVDEDRIYVRKFYIAEITAANVVKSMLKSTDYIAYSNPTLNRKIEEMEKEDKIKYSEEQVKAIKMALQNRISIITGGPGRGKTTILKAVYRIWAEDPLNKEPPILLAPTGRAAKRLSEAVGAPASTIHRFIRRLSADFAKRASVEEKTYLKDRLIIADEMSMAGLLLAEKLLSISKYNNLLIVGDVDQLPSIEPGNFLKDMIYSYRVPVTRLTHGYRSDAAIAETAQKINEGHGPDKYILDDSCQFIDAGKEDILGCVAKQYEELKKNGIDDILVLSPIRKKGLNCVDRLNDLIQEKFNPLTKEMDSFQNFRSGDRVMNIVNDYSRVKTVSSPKTGLFSEVYETGVFNGDTGNISQIDSEDETITVLFDDGKESDYTFDAAKENLVLSYASTIHKSQGSEYDAVILVISPEYSFFMNRNMLYTAVTRAKKRLIMIGDRKTASIVSKKLDTAKRNSNLTQRIIS